MKLSSPSRPAFLALALSAAAFSVFSTGCTSLKDTGDAAEGATCSSTVNGGGDSASLTSALSSAGAGSCVVLVSQTYTGSFSVPAGITLSSARGTRAVFRSTDDKPAIELAGGANGGGASLFGIDVIDTKGVGIVVRGGGAHLQDVSVSGAKSAAVAIQCKEAACLDGNHVVTLDNVRMKTSAMGLWASGAHVRMKGGESSDHGGETLTGGLGIVAQDGARLELTGTKVERNTSVGVLLDGSATTGQMTDVTVSNNAARGVWAQKLQGTFEAPSLRIEGKTLIENNKIVGLGAAGSRGIIIVGGRIGNTVAAPVVSNLGSTESIGDGIGIFSGAGDVRVEGVELFGNARAAALFDKANGAIIIVGGKVEAGGIPPLKVVVQNPAAGVRVEVATDVLSTVETPLGISAPDVPLARVLP